MHNAHSWMVVRFGERRFVDFASVAGRVLVLVYTYRNGNRGTTLSLTGAWKSPRVFLNTGAFFVQPIRGILILAACLPRPHCLNRVAGSAVWLKRAARERRSML